MKFPIKRNPNECTIPISKVQEIARQSMLEKVRNGSYKLRKNSCLCDSKDSGDIRLIEYDRYCTPVSLLLCKQCSLLRTDPVLDDFSLIEFYKNDFSLLHRGTTKPSETYLNYVIPTGRELSQWLLNKLPIDEVNNVAELGCATGANLLPFYEIGKNVIGYDFDINYLEYGRSKGLNLVEGAWEDKLNLASQDLVILSHVLEHMTNPIQSIVQIIELVRPGKYVYMEVPGVFSIIRRWKRCPTKYFQHDHIYHYHEAYLRGIVDQVGAEVVYCDEWCRLLIRRPVNWKPIAVSQFTDELPAKIQEISRFIKWSYRREQVMSRVHKYTEIVGIKPLLKKLLSRTLKTG